jgi:hypothetical protein
MFAENAEVHAEGLLAIAAVLAGSVTQTWVDYDNVANANVAYILTNRVDHTSTVGAEYPAGTDGDTGQATDDKKIEMVERRGTHAHTNISRPPQLGYWEIVTQLELVETAVRGEGQAFHENGAVILMSD